MNLFESGIPLQNTLSLIRRHWLVVALYAVLFVIAMWGVATLMPELIDWVRTYRPATIELISGRSPYGIKSFFNPPWILLPLIPMALLPSKVGGALLFVISFAVFIFVANKSKATKISVVAFLFSFPVLFCLLFGQIDWMILLGFFLPPQIGLFFILAKPQVGAAGALFILIECWRRGGIREVLKVFLPVGIAFILSFIFYGPWFANTDPSILKAIYNLSLWPESIPIGLVFLIYAIRQRRKEFSMAAGPFLSPYVAPHSWSIALLSILPMQWETIAASLASWVIFYIGLSRSS